MREFLNRMWEMLMGRGEGPLTFRLILQPTMAAILAIRAGLRDARAGQPAWFLWSLLTDPARRPELLAQVRKDVGKVFGLAVVLDVIYSLIVYRWIHPVQTIIVATVLAIVPYLLLRGPVTLIARRFVHPIPPGTQD